MIDDSDTSRALRGGSFISQHYLAACAFRNFFRPSFTSLSFGLRLAVGQSVF